MSEFIPPIVRLRKDIQDAHTMLLGRLGCGEAMRSLESASEALRSVESDYRSHAYFIQRLINATGYDINWVQGSICDEGFFRHLNEMLHEESIR